MDTVSRRLPVAGAGPPEAGPLAFLPDQIWQPLAFWPICTQPSTFWPSLSRTELNFMQPCGVTRCLAPTNSTMTVELEPSSGQYVPTPHGECSAPPCKKDRVRVRIRVGVTVTVTVRVRVRC